MGEPGCLVSVDWLKDNLTSVKLLDASWFLPSQGRDATAEFVLERIPGSLRFDIDQVADTAKSLPHMLPTESHFSRAATALGVQPEDTVVIYDRLGIFSSPRAWWTWKAFGHANVAVLNGGYPAWKAAGLDVDQQPGAPENLREPGAEEGYPAKLQPAVVKSMGDMQEVLSAGSAQVVDARSSGRFRGLAPEPRADIKSGHMAGAKNLPFTELLEGGALGGAFCAREELEAAFTRAEVDVQQPMIFTCGSGATAGVLALAAFQLTGKVTPIYDGSWMEWATSGGDIVSEADP